MSYDMKSITVISHLRWLFFPPLVPYGTTFPPAERWDNKAPQSNPFISRTTISTGYSAPACGGKVVAPATKGGNTGMVYEVYDALFFSPYLSFPLEGKSREAGKGVRGRAPIGCSIAILTANRRPCQGSTVSTGYSAPVEVLHRTSKWGAERHLNPQARQGLSIRRRPLWEYRKAHFPPTGIYRHSSHLLFLPRSFALWRPCRGPPSQPKLALSLHIKGPSYCRLTDPG